MENTPSTSEPSVPVSRMGFRRVLTPNRMQWLMPLIGGLCIASLAAVRARFMPNFYRSEVSILANIGRMASTPTGIWTPGQAHELGGRTEENGEATTAYADILRSRWLMERLLDETYSFDQEDWGFGPGPIRHYESNLRDYLKAKTTERGLMDLGAMMSVSRDLKSGLLSIRVESRSPELSRQVARKSVALLEDFLVQLSQKAGDQKKAFTERQLRNAQREYDEVERRLMGFLAGNNNYQTSPDPTVKVRGERLYSELDRAKQVVTNLSLHHEQAQIDAANDIPTLMVLDDGSLPESKSRPSRASFVILAFLGTYLVLWAYANRDWIGSILIAKE